MNNLRIQKKLQTILSEERFEHCLMVSSLSRELAGFSSVDMEKAVLAGLLHDCAKELGPEKMKEYLEQVKKYMDDDELVCRGVWHAYVGSVYAIEVFGISDVDVLRAIRTHSVGEKGMTDLQAVVYVADACASRDKEHQAERDVMLQIAKKHLWKGVLAVVTFKLGLGEAHGTVPLKKGLVLKEWVEAKFA
jgi:predicted HD superfamily hydrolase involved in NAD metabolism